MVIDRHWELVDANEAVGLLTAGAAAHLLEPPVNVLRLSLHPDGMAPRIANLAQWRTHLFERLRQQVEATGDAQLAEMLEELRGYPGGGSSAPPASGDTGALIVPLRYHTPAGVLSLFSTTTVFGTPRAVTISAVSSIVSGRRE